MKAKRPPPHRWIAYAVGFKLPDRYDDWVFHDLNDRLWQVREVGRIMALALPIAVAMVVFIPGELGLRLSTASFLVIGPLFVGGAYVDEFRNYRLRQHGLLPPSGPDPDWPD